MNRGTTWAGLALAGTLAAGCGDTAGAPTAVAPSISPRPASNMRLRAQLSPSQLAPGATAGSGNWGYTAPDGRRLALNGVSNGLAVVDVTDPGAPRVVGHFAGAQSSWREVKTYRTYAYVTTEARIGLDIIDLRDPASPRRVQTLNRTFASAHTIWIDEARGLAFVNGTRDGNGNSRGVRVLDLAANPENPPDIGEYTASYVHDSFSQGNTLYASAINDGALVLIDVRDPRQPREITRFQTGGRFTHNAWLTGDGRYVFTTDERAGRPVEGWDIADPFAPRKVSEYIAAPNTIPHNVMIDGTRLLVSHYTEGVHLLDVRDPTRPAVLGFYDTYAPADSGFHGAWGAYVFPGSNIIVVGDIEGGLFVLEYTGP